MNIIRKARPKVLALWGDDHAGSLSGLLVPPVWNLQQGGTYRPTQDARTAQKVIRRQFLEYADGVGRLRKGADFHWVHGGDPIEGKHHHATDYISPLVVEHRLIHLESAEEFNRRTFYNPDKGDSCSYIKGTTPHDGNGGQDAEAIARDIDGIIPCRPPEGEEGGGAYLWKKRLLNIHGVKFRITHKGASRGRRAWTAENGLLNKIKSIAHQGLKNRKYTIPDWCIYFHNHQYTRATYEYQIDGQYKKIHGVIMPCFQGPTDYVLQLDPEEWPSIGALAWKIAPDGETELHEWVAEYEPQEYAKV